MEIPLSIRERAGLLIASPSIAYRIACGSVLALLIAALAADGSPPGMIGWAFLVLAALATLYEESWIFDPAAGRIVHRAGILPFVAAKSLLIAEVDRVRIAPFVRGTVPGSAEEVRENDAALSGGRGDDTGRKRFSFKRHYLCIVLETAGGERYLVDAASSRRAAALLERAARIAAFIGLPLEKG